MASVTVTLIPAEQINRGLYHHCSVAEAAAILGVSESTIRRAAHKAGVRRLGGRTVRGGIVFDRHPVPIAITYSA